MSGDRSNEASAIASLALAFHRSPARHADLMHGVAPLPPSVSVLLRLAGGTAPHELSPGLESMGSADELKAAALFFIEQVLFQRDASHYRVLGLNQGAAPEQIKENHRLLMRLFHPDREEQADERRQQYATRANLAYNTLRDADQRSSYDTTLKPAAPAFTMRAPPRATGPMRRPMPAPESFWTVRVYPLLMRYLPQWVLAGTALVSVSIVGAVYLFNPPVHLPQHAAVVSADEVVDKPAPPASAPEAVAKMASAEATRLDEVVAQFERRIAGTGPELAPAPVKAVAPAAPKALAEPPVIARPAPAPVKLAPVNTARIAPVRAPQQAQTRLVQKPAAVAAPAPMPAPVARASIPEPPRQIAPAAPPALPPPEPVRPAVVAAAATAAPAVIEPAPQPALPDPDTLLKRFLEAYERGDTQTCMALLDEAARTDAGGKGDLRRDYEAIFRSTDLRHIKVTGMNWQRDGEFIRGEGRFRATLMRKGETLLRTQDGQVRVELVRRGSTALINELRYLAGKS